jgi:hypothetical protein
MMAHRIGRNRVLASLPSPVALDTRGFRRGVREIASIKSNRGPAASGTAVT